MPGKQKMVSMQRTCGWFQVTETNCLLKEGFADWFFSRIDLSSHVGVGDILDRSICGSAIRPKSTASPPMMLGIAAEQPNPWNLLQPEPEGFLLLQSADKMTIYADL